MPTNCYVALLPTKKTSSVLWLTPSDKLLHTHVSGSVVFEYTPQHIYILTDSDVNKGDYYFFRHGGETTINLAEAEVKSVQEWRERGITESRMNESLILKRIVATSDESLGLPILPFEFLEQYVTLYNEFDQITEAYVEYEDYQDSINYHHDIFHNFTRVKRNIDNTVNINRGQDTYTRAEVEKILRLSAKTSLTLDSFIKMHL